MKKTILFVFVVAALFSSCKSSKKITGTKETPVEQTQPKVFTAENTNNTQTTTSSNSNTSYVKPDSSPISMRKENFSFSQASDQNTYGNKNFFVIVGSFSNYDNAVRLKSNLSNKGFYPIILKSESGYYRVCINSYTDETDARDRVREIRQRYPQYSDCWLLIKN